jgi:serralysin
MNVTLGSGHQDFAILRTGPQDDTILDFKSTYFSATLNGAQETPANGSAATGTATGAINLDQTRFAFIVTVSGIDLDGAQTPGSNLDNMNNFHIHRAAPGVAGGIVYNPEPDGEYVVNGAAGTLTSGWDAAEGLGGVNLAALLADGAYFNVHTVQFGGGEIRGQILKADSGLDRIDLTALNIGGFSTLQLLLTETAGSASVSALFNGQASKVTLSGVGIAQLAAADFLFAGTVNETVVGTIGADDLFGAGGADTLRGLAGNDRLFGEDGNDRMEGGIGNDIFYAGAGDVVAELANEGIDRVRTALAVYTLGANVERLEFTDTANHKGKGNTLDNTLYGNSGNDNFYADAGGSDAFSGGLGVDTMFYNAAGAVVLNFSTNVHGGAAAGDGFASIEKFQGSETGDDTMTAGVARTNFAGQGGNDTLTGGANIDTFFGGTGNDILSAGAAIDFLSGGSGNDTMTGGADRDYFIYIETAAAGGFGADTVTDWQDGLDILKIDMPVADSIADFAIAGNGTATVTLTLIGAAGNSITLNGAGPITITAADLLFY